MKRSARPTGPDPALADLAQAVLLKRQALDFTQEEAAHRAGLSLRHYQNLESGRLNPSYLTLKAVAAALSIDVGDLFAQQKKAGVDAAPSA